jgi:hypothetical protein
MKKYTFQRNNVKHEIIAETREEAQMILLSILGYQEVEV